MTEQVSISASPQGTTTGTVKAQSAGKGTGFMGMLMAAIGRKSANDTTLAAHGVSAAAQSADKHAKNPDGKGLTLIDAVAKAMADNGKQGAASKTHGKTGAATLLIDAGAQAKAGADKGAKAQVKSDAAALAKAGGKEEAAAKARAKSGTAAALIEADAQAMAGGSPIPTGQAAGKAPVQGKNEMGKGFGHADAHGHKHADKSPADEIAANAQPTVQAMAALGSASSAAAASQDAGGNAGQGSSARAGSKSAGNGAHALPASQGKANIADGQAQALLQDGAEQAGKAAAQPDAHARLTDAKTAEASPSSGQTAAAASASLLASADGQANIASHVQGRQAGPTGKPSSQAKDAQAKNMQGKEGIIEATASQHAKTGTTIAGMTAVQASTHMHDAADANAHAGSSHVEGSQSSQAGGAAAPKPGIHSYARIAASTQTHTTTTLPAQATSASIPSHPTLPGKGGHDAGSALTAQSSGPDLTAAATSLTVGPGIGQSAQATPMSQMPPPQAAAHASGPWTTMAAMVEIGQAAANGLTRLELKLEPAHLGKVHVHIQSDSRKNIQVHMVVEQPTSRQAIEQQLPNLRHAMEQHGLNLGNFSMSSQQQGSGQGSAQQGQQTFTASAPSFSAPRPQAPQITNTPSAGLPPANGRLSIRV